MERSVKTEEEEEGTVGPSPFVRCVRSAFLLKSSFLSCLPTSMYTHRIRHARD